MEHPLREVVLIDTETTGFGPGARLVEVAALHVRAGEAVGSFQTLVRPGVPIPWAATRVHGITDAMVRDAPTEAEAARQLRDFLGSRPLVAHNASFDVAVLRGAFARAGVTAPGCVVWCSLAMSRRVFPEAASHRLGALASSLGLASGVAHRAMGDVQTTRALLGEILRRSSARELRAMGPSAVL